MQVVRIAKKDRGYQDGAIYDGKIFRLDHLGHCQVISLENFEVLSEFKLNDLEKQVPHSNAVCMGKIDGELFLYTNVYNNYKGDPLGERRGVCCVYKITQVDANYNADLVQTIEIGFFDKKGLWISKNKQDIRPYGNFVVDFLGKKIYAFTMIDEDNVTRFFEFDLPSVKDKKVVLNEQDILSAFDSTYSKYLQGATFNKGYVLSVEGMSNNPDLPPYLRIIDVKNKSAVLEQDLTKLGINIEAEFIDVFNGQTLFGDYEGNYYKIEI